MTDGDRLHAEQHARVLIDAQLAAAGWLVQDVKDISLFTGQGIGVREAIMAAGHCRADHVTAALAESEAVAAAVEASAAGSPTDALEED